jgi:hypothetical protein
MAPGDRGHAGWARAVGPSPAEVPKVTDLPLKGQTFHGEAENRLFRRPQESGQDAKKTQLLNEF